MENIKTGKRFYLGMTLLTISSVHENFAICEWEFNGNKGKIGYPLSCIKDKVF